MFKFSLTAEQKKFEILNFLYQIFLAGTLEKLLQEHL